LYIIILLQKARVTRLGECLLGKCFKKFISVPNNGAPFSTVKVLYVNINFDKNGLGYILGEFWINSSDHLAKSQKAEFQPWKSASFVLTSN
jgi:hypothetical protein